MKKHSILLGTLLCLSQLISAQVYPLRPKLSHERSFSMVLIPDPQSYVNLMLINLSLSCRLHGLPIA